MTIVMFSSVFFYQKNTDSRCTVDQLGFNFTVSSSVVFILQLIYPVQEVLRIRIKQFLSVSTFEYVSWIRLQFLRVGTGV